MNPLRRSWLMRLAVLAPLAPGAAAAALSDEANAQAQGAGALAGSTSGGVRRGRALVFPRDHGAHPDTRTEWWYVTGWLGTPQQPTHGFQLTFFRSRTGLAADNGSRFAARQLLFAHAALTLLQPARGAPRHLHDQRIARWSGAAQAALGATSVEGGDVHLQGWSLRDEGTAWRARIAAASFELDLRLARSQPLLLQGEAGYSRKGPQESQASHYVSEPQLQASGVAREPGDAAAAAGAALSGRAWMDHEWSDQILHPEAVGWDWIGINLFDGSALTAFALRRADGTAIWAGGSWRLAGTDQPTAFAPTDVRMQPGRIWASPGSGARYPVQWTVETPAGRHVVRALLDAQELDSRSSTGTVYWEGLSELLDAEGRRAGLGYLEMTGYAGRLRIG